MIGRHQAARGDNAAWIRSPPEPHGRSMPPPRKFKSVPETISTGAGEGGDFRVGSLIGTGSFGEIYHGTNVETKEQVAIKLESLKARFPQLIYELKIYRKLGGETGIPNVRWFGIQDDFSVLVMDLLGPNLEELFDSCDRKLSLKTVLMLADQMIDRVECVHSNFFVHRDIKPQNFLMGTGKSANLVHIIDFGIAKKYMERSKHKMQHIPYSLPWQGIEAGNHRQTHEMIKDMKIATSPEMPQQNTNLERWWTEARKRVRKCDRRRFDTHNPNCLDTMKTENARVSDNVHKQLNSEQTVEHIEQEFKLWEFARRGGSGDQAQD
ncbi:hypothetical protein ACQ4PT_001488 [Festuca glaucescens]